MNQWLNDVEGLTLKGRIAVPYTWWVGEVGSRFLLGLRDEQKILGNRCESCGTCYVPPRKNCGRCFKEIHEWVQLGTEGVVKAHTVVHFPSPLQPAPPPFAYALIRLDGADVDFLHVIKNGLDRLKNGIRVRARFRGERSGDIRDLEAFEIIESDGGK
jgi:hypothetical protein